MAQMIRAATTSKTMVVLTFRAFCQLIDEQGGRDAAMRWLVNQAHRAQVPIGVNFPRTADPNGPSTTAFVPPRGWGESRVKGWIGARHEELGATFGETVGGVRRVEEMAQREA